MNKLVAGALAAVSLWGAAPNPVAWNLEGMPATIRRGARFTAKLTAAIQPGWHLYSTKPVADGPIPTRIRIGENQPVRLAGPIQSPHAQTIQDPNFGMEVEFYEGNAVFTLPLQVSEKAQPGAQTAQVNVSYQACNDKLCLPPKTVTVEAPIQAGN